MNLGACTKTKKTDLIKSFFSGVKGIDCISRMNGDDIWTEGVIDSMTHPINDQSIYRGQLPLRRSAIQTLTFFL